jgi:MOSC domain-containing protein YiiM
MNDKTTDGRVEAIFTASEGSAPMDRCDRVEAVEGGLVGDRYLTGRGFYSPYDVCQVTLVAGEALDSIREREGIDLRDGRHRRNLVTRDADLRALLEATFRVGPEGRGTILRGTRPRPPCVHVEDVADEQGLASAMGRKGGICADVLGVGTVAVDDPIEIIKEDPRTEGRAIIERLRSEEPSAHD